MSDAARFVEKFSDIWSNPDPERYQELWTDDGRLLHPGMEAPISAGEIGDYVAGVLKATPDLVLTPERWAAADDFVLIEWTARATFQGEKLEWTGVDRFTLRGDRATEGIAWFDTLPLWQRVDPSMKRGAIEEAAAAQLASA